MGGHHDAEAALNPVEAPNEVILGVGAGEDYAFQAEGAGRQVEALGAEGGVGGARPVVAGV